MGVLSFDKPKKIKPTKEHQEYYSSDSGILGTYVPNMSDEDRLKWKAKIIGGADQRVEIRKTVGGTQMLLIVRADNVVMSANGRMTFTLKGFKELEQAVQEARDLVVNADVI